MARGGPVDPGDSYLIVGEGPEIFIPKRSGYIISNQGGDLMEKVSIVHQDTGATATVTRRSYEQVWKPLGWRLGKPKKETPEKEGK